MKQLLSHLKPLLFFLGGAGVGIAYYAFAGIPLSPGTWISILCTALIGWLASELFQKECKNQCNT